MSLRKAKNLEGKMGMQINSFFLGFLWQLTTSTNTCERTSTLNIAKGYLCHFFMSWKGQIIFHIFSLSHS